MPLLEWSDKYSTNIRVIDTDHQNLFDAINALYDANEAGLGSERIGDVIKTLRKYVVVHFQHEEHVLEQAGYPEFDKHRATHRDFNHVINSLAEMYRLDPDSVDINKVINFLSDWLTEHILKSDMDYVPYVRGEKEGNPPPETSVHGPQTDVHIAFTVPANKAELIKGFVDSVIGEDLTAENFEKAFAAAHQILEENSLARAKKLFGVD